MKSTFAAMLIAWATVFYPENTAIILNIRKDAGVGNIRKVQQIIEALPSWMFMGNKPYQGSGPQVTQIKLWNKSEVKVMYPSSQVPPDTLARSLTSSVLYIDESAFIPHMEEIYGSAKPILSTATKHAISNGFPYFTLITSTPNGKQGVGKWFYDIWNESLDSDILFENDPDDETKEIMDETADLNKLSTAGGLNGFVKIRYHWSEAKDRDNTWYEQEKLGLKPRQVNQELDLVFVGGKDGILDDEIIQQMEPIHIKNTIMTPINVPLRIYQEVDPLDWYLIGVDTSIGTSELSAFNALQIMKFSDLSQIGELHHKYGSIKKWAEDIIFVIKWLRQVIGDRMILCVENNTIGMPVIEYLLECESINLAPYIYYDDPKKPGITTSAKTKPLMLKYMIDEINANPKLIKSSYLIDQFTGLEHAGTKTFTSPTFTDLVMASLFCAYTRYNKFAEIMPFIQVENKKVDNIISNNVTSMLSLNDPKEYIKSVEKMKSMNEIPLSPIKPGENNSIDVLESLFGSNFDNFNTPQNDGYTFFGYNHDLDEYNNL